MRHLTKIIFLVLVAVVLVSAVAVLTPRAVRAAADLFEDVDSPVRNPWTATCTVSSSSTSVGGCSISLSAGQQVAIQTLTFQGYTSDIHTHLLMELITNGGGYEMWSNQIEAIVPILPFPLPRLSIPSHISSYSSSFPITMYATPGNEVIVFAISTDSGNPGGMAGILTLVGYTAGNVNAIVN